MGASAAQPSEAVLTFIAVFRRFDPAGAAVTQEFALATLGSAQAHHVAVLAAITANGILRRLAQALKPPPPPGTVPAQLAAARTLVDNALFQGPPAARTLRPHQEVQETADLLAARPGSAKAVPGAKADPAGGLHRVVLGRDVAVGRSDPAKVGGDLHRTGVRRRLLLDPFLADDAKGLKAARPRCGGPAGAAAARRCRWRPLDAVQARTPGCWPSARRLGGARPGRAGALLFVQGGRRRRVRPVLRVHGLDVERIRRRH